MSKSMNMLRTRRRDNNVKPNRRLDRKSSRGMLYENEELRLKTININAEIERGQSDIKKLKRENEMLKKEIWCLRDEYEKLDKLIKEKQLDLCSSSSTCSSDSESCSSCSEESEEVETSQNIENVQKTNLKNLHTEFDHLSVVPEENSPENSDRNSSHEQWNGEGEKNVLKADQSYPAYDNLNKISTLPINEKMPKHFFSPIRSNGNFPQQENVNQTLYSHQNYSDIYTPCKFTTFKPLKSPDYVNLPLPPPPPPPLPTNEKIMNTNFHQVNKNQDSLTEMQPLNKSTTDLIVKMDNYNFNTNSQSTFSNGGNLEELLNDIECISQDILKISNSQHNVSTVGNDVKNEEDVKEVNEKPYKSELNVVLMPTPMPLIGFDKYRNISCENLNSKSAETLSVSNPNLRIMPDGLVNYPDGVVNYPDGLANYPDGIVNYSDNFLPQTSGVMHNNNEINPFFFGNFPNPQSEYFHARYNPNTFLNENQEKLLEKSEKEICNSKSNLLDITSSEHVSSENEENLKFKTTQSTNNNNNPPEENKIVIKNEEEAKTDNKKNENKTPKLSLRRKVSIHFKGKKDKDKIKNKNDNSDKKLDVNKKNVSLQKTPSLDSKKSAIIDTPNDIKIQTPSDKKSSTTTTTTTTDQRNSNSDKEKGPTTPGSSKDKDKDQEKKSTRKSTSVSPDRKHVHVKEDGKKCHKKHKRLEKQRSRRSVVSNDRFHRERSYSVCTDRSNILDHRLGLGFSSFGMYDDYSDRDRSNSLSSCDTVNRRKMSSISQFPVNGKIPWCGCWGNGCL